MYNGMFKEYILHLILFIGYIVYQLLPFIHCPTCLPALSDSDMDKLDTETARLIILKNRAIIPDKVGGLQTPSLSTFKIIQAAEDLFKKNVVRGKRFPSCPELVDTLTETLMRKLDVTGLFPTLKHHSLEHIPGLEEPHDISLTKFVASRYFSFRYKSYSTVVNRSLHAKTSDRNQRMKLTQFENR